MAWKSDHEEESCILTSTLASMTGAQLPEEFTELDIIQLLKPAAAPD